MIAPNAVEVAPSYEMHLCSRCSLIFSWPMVHPGAHWYERADNYELSSLGEKIVSTVAPERLLRGAHHPFFRDLPGRGGRLLDVGCGRGEFLAVAGKSYTVEGFDLQERAIQVAKTVHGMRNIRVATLSQFYAAWKQSHGECYNVVTLFDVLEHLEDPAASVRMVQEMLCPGGWVVITLPNRARWPDFYREHDHPPNHLTRWSKEALAHFLTSHGLTVMKAQDFNEPGYVGLRFIHRLLAPILRLVRARETGSSRARHADGEITGRGSVSHHLVARLWYIHVRVGMLLDAPIYTVLRWRGAPGQMLYCLARRVDSAEASTAVDGA